MSFRWPSVMPLIRRASRRAFTQNLKTEIAAGKPRKQALAIAYAVQRRAASKKKSPAQLNREIGEALSRRGRR